MKRTYIAFWLKFLIWLFTTIVFFTTSSYFVPIRYALFGSLITSFIFLGVLLINEYWLFHKYFLVDRRKFILVNIFIVLVITGIHFSLEYYLVPKEISKIVRTEKMPIYFPILRSFGMVAMANFISVTLLLAKELKRKAENEKQLKEEKLGTEIKLLKAQINPHFIFNALNNIYSLTYTKSEMAPESVLKLSEMLRYVFYDCSNDHVKMGAEIEYISNYIAFQKMKSEHQQNIDFDISEIKKEIDISPMIFIPFIENAFKYSKVEEFKDAFVDMKLGSENGSVFFEISNSIPSETRALSGNGLGIMNVQQRLEILYPEKHNLEIQESAEKYIVKLEIQTI